MIFKRLCKSDKDNEGSRKFDSRKSGIKMAFCENDDKLYTVKEKND